MLGLVLCQAESASASAFNVNPVQVFLSTSASSALLTITNESQDTLRFQITVFAWNQDEKGQMQLSATNDIVFFPTLLSLAPKEQKKVRVGATAPVGPIEKSYRIFFEELPPLDKTNEGSPRSPQVQVLTKMGIPIFLQPVKPSARGAVEEISVKHGTLSFRVRNTGSAHFTLQGVRVRGMGEGAQPLFERQAEGWYVLAAGSRVYELPMPMEECPRMKSVAIEAQADRETFKASVAVPPGACAGN
jgi:fimbrial chaperone protein